MSRYCNFCGEKEDEAPATLKRINVKVEINVQEEPNSNVYGSCKFEGERDICLKCSEGMKFETKGFLSGKFLTDLVNELKSKK